MMAAKFECVRALKERTGGTQGAFSIGQMASVLHPGIFVTKLGVTCQVVTVTIYDLHHLNGLLCYHLLKVTCLLG